LTKQEPPEIFDQRVEVDIFDEAMIERDITSFGETFSFSHVDPI
jgi:hypothetical protein